MINQVSASKQKWLCWLRHSDPFFTVIWPSSSGRFSRSECGQTLAGQNYWWGHWGATLHFQNYWRLVPATPPHTHILFLCLWHDIHQGPVVQSIVRLTKSLVNDSLSLLVRLKSSVLIFLLKNCEELLHCKSSSHFFCKKWQCFYV